MDTEEPEDLPQGDKDQHTHGIDQNGQRVSQNGVDEAVEGLGPAGNRGDDERQAIPEDDVDAGGDGGVEAAHDALGYRVGQLDDPVVLHGELGDLDRDEGNQDGHKDAAGT